MNILCIIPPYIPSYFNAGHHLPIFQVAAYLRHTTNHTIDAIDAAALNFHWKDLCDLLIKGYDCIVLLNDFDGIDTFDRFIRYTRTFSPQAKIVTFGRLSKQIPSFFFEKYDLDAVVVSGDYEAAIKAYINFVEGNQNDPKGVWIHGHTFPPLGKFLEAKEWVLPEVREIPYQAYTQLYKNDLNKFCGIPDRLELVVPVARGCPINCFYCDVPSMQGKKEQRLSVEATIAYIKESFCKIPFDYVSFYAPTFTLKKYWVEQFCYKIQEEARQYPWKCATTLRFLDKPLILLMKAAGCVRISIGIETLSPNSKHIGLPSCKQDMRSYFLDIAQYCQEIEIELNSFIILGLPNDRLEDIHETIKLCLAYGVRVRPTIYTPYHEIHPHVSKEEISTYNRQIFVKNLVSKEEELAYYKIFYANEEDKVTHIMNKIPKLNKQHYLHGK